MASNIRNDNNYKNIVRPYDAFFNNRRTEVYAKSEDEAIAAAARKFATEQSKVVVILSKN